MDFRNFSLKNNPKRLRNMIIVSAIFMCLIFGIMYIVSDFNKDEGNVAYIDRFDVLDSGWTIKTSESEYQAELPAWIDAEGNEEIHLSRHIIMDRATESSTAFSTRNYHNMLTAYVDGELVYKFPSDNDVVTDVIITDDWSMINVPDDLEEFDIEIIFKTSSAGFNGFINEIYFGEDNSILAFLKSKYMLLYSLAIIVVVIGALLIVVESVFSKDFADKSPLLLGFVFMIVGLWFANRSRFPAFTVGSNIQFFLVFCGMTFLPLLLTLYAGERFSEHNQTVVNIFTIIDILLIIAVFMIVAIWKIPIHAVISYVYLGVFASCLYTVYLMWYYSRGKGSRWLSRVQLNSVRLELLAAVLFVVFSILSILWDAISTNNWSTTQRDWSGVGALQMLGVIIFAFSHFIVLLYNGYYGVIESEETQKKLHDSQLQLMMGQIQPHFMFNTLSSIRTLIKIDPDMAYNMTYNFSNYLRANVDNLTNMDGIKFAAEVKHIESYVNIEQVRFGDRLNVEYDIKESDFIVPPLSIQPLVENAIKHGVCKRPEGGTVWLRSYKEGTNYIVEVEDNGVGISPKRMKEVFEGKVVGPSSDDDFYDSGFDNTDLNLTGNGSEVHESTGMKNIMVRLKEISNATLDVTSEEGKGTLMRVEFPIDDRDPSGIEAMK